jgi:hypothetical protein
LVKAYHWLHDRPHVIWLAHASGTPPPASERKEKPMAVLVVSDVSAQSPEGYDQMLEALSGALREAPGFIMHMAHPTDAAWRVVEVWHSKEDATRFYAANVAPKLPDGIRPKLSFQPLHSLLRR